MLSNNATDAYCAIPLIYFIAYCNVSTWKGKIFMTLTALQNLMLVFISTFHISVNFQIN